MSEYIDQIITTNLTPTIETYFSKFQENWNADNKKGMETWLKQIEQTLNFIGVNDKNDKR